MRYSRLLITTATIALWCGATASAQTPGDAAARLKEVLPANVATRVLAVIELARSRGLPVEPLENRALKFAARGVHPDSIEKSVVEHEARMERAKVAIEQARGGKAAADEVEAAAEAIRKGLDGAKITELAKSASSGRSLAVPLYVLGGLLDRGLPSDDAIQRVVDKLRARSSDRELEKLSSDVPPGGGSQNQQTRDNNGRAVGQTARPATTAGNNGVGRGGGPPAGVPANGGAAAKPKMPNGRGKPETPPGKKP